MGYIEGHSRDQMLLLPAWVDDYVGADNPARFIAAFVDDLDLGELGFDRSLPKPTGHPGYEVLGWTAPNGIAMCQGAVVHRIIRLRLLGIGLRQNRSNDSWRNLLALPINDRSFGKHSNLRNLVSSYPSGGARLAVR
jgi:hypothetical protein